MLNRPVNKGLTAQSDITREAATQCSKIKTEVMVFKLQHYNYTWVTITITYNRISAVLITGCLPAKTT